MSAAPAFENRYLLSLYEPSAQSIEVAGDFTGWEPIPLQPLPDGTWQTFTVPLEPTDDLPIRVRYKFVINGEHWVTDPDHLDEIAGDSYFTIPPQRPVPLVALGTVDSIEIYSPALARTMPAYVYLPPGMEKGRRYPSIYLLHGYHDGGCADFLEKGFIHEAMDRLIGVGKIPPAIVVLVEGEESFYSDRLDGMAPYERYLCHDVIEAIDARYPTIPERWARGIGGLSMGGFGAVKLALQYPHRFRSVAAHAGLYDVRDPRALVEVFGEGPACELHRRWNSPVELIEDPSRVRDLKLYFDCGEQDHLFGSGLAFHKALTKLGIPHRFERCQGYHTWDFVQRRLPHALAWHAQHLQAPGEQLGTGRVQVNGLRRR